MTKVRVGGGRWYDPLVIRGMAYSQASGANAWGPGAGKEKIKGHGQVPFREPAAEGQTAISGSAIPLKSRPHCLLGSSQPMAHCGRGARACPFLPLVRLL